VPIKAEKESQLTERLVSRNRTATRTPEANVSAAINPTAGSIPMASAVIPANSAPIA